MRLVIFDMDGTLIDSVGLIVETVTAAFTAVGEQPPDEAAIRAISGLAVQVAFEQLAPKADEAGRDALVRSYRAQYEGRAGGGREPMFAGALEALERLRQQPDTVLAVATGKGHRGAVTLLTAHGILEKFHSVETPDHNRSKPDPQMIETAMRKAGATAAQTVMIGDTVHDMHMAKAAGVKAIGVAWGYHDTIELNAAGADVVIGRFDELDGAIDQVLGAVDA